jgi:NAD-dependent dihydropyrimidine dehydrogenase PreA subunit
MNDCPFCNMSFTRKDNVTKHIKEDRCIKAKEMTPYDFYKIIDDLQERLTCIDNEKVSNSVTNFNYNVKNYNNYTSINVQIQILPINKLSLDHISPDKMKELIEKYDHDRTKLQFLLKDYINNILCDNEHPENHAIKYIKRYPPTFNSVTEDSEGNIITVIKGLKDTCELLSDPLLDVLKVKLTECIKKYKKDTADDNSDYDYTLYEDAIRELRKELNKDKIKKILSNFLKNDLINNIEMKLKINVKSIK